MSEKYELMRAEKASYPVKMMASLPDQFSSTSLYRMQELMGELGVRGCAPNTSKKTTIQDPRAKEKRDLIRRDFTSRMLLDWAGGNNVRPSCSRTGNCHDNAVAESFFATLKNETCYRTTFATRGEARHAVVESVEAHHDRKRPHSAIGYQIPADAMGAFFERLDRATQDVEEVPMAAWLLSFFVSEILTQVIPAVCQRMERIAPSQTPRFHPTAARAQRRSRYRRPTTSELQNHTSEVSSEVAS